MLAAIRETIIFVLDNLSKTEMALYLLLVLAICMCFLLALLLVFRGLALLAGLIVLLSLAAMPYSLFALHALAKTSLRPVQISDISYKPLEYSPSVLVDFELKNLSKKDFNTCLAQFVFYQPEQSSLKNLLNIIKSKNSASFILNGIKARDSKKITKSSPLVLGGGLSIKSWVECY